MNLTCSFQDDVGLAKQLLTLEVLGGDSVSTGLAAHFLNKYSDRYDTRELWNIALLRTVCDDVIQQYDSGRIVP